MTLDSWSLLELLNNNYGYEHLVSLQVITDDGDKDRFEAHVSNFF